MRYIRHILSLLTAAAAVVLTACTTAEVTPRPTLTVSIEPLRYVVEAITDTAYDVEVLTPAGASPETYQPTPKQLAAMSTSVAYFRVGTLGFERTQLDRVTQNMPHVVSVNASRGILSLPVDDAHDGTHEADPHTWMNPHCMKIIARNVCNTLCGLDTLNATRYSERLHAFNNRMDSLDHRLRTMLDSLPSRAFLVYHPALAYFARPYALRQISVQTDGREASAARMAELIAECRREKVGVVFIEKEYSGGTARSIAREIGAEVVEINPLAHDWENEMVNIATALCRQKAL